MAQRSLQDTSNNSQAPRICSSSYEKDLHDDNSLTYANTPATNSHVTLYSQLQHSPPSTDIEICGRPRHGSTQFTGYRNSERTMDDMTTHACTNHHSTQHSEPPTQYARTQKQYFESHPTNVALCSALIGPQRDELLHKEDEYGLNYSDAGAEYPFYPQELHLQTSSIDDPTTRDSSFKVQNHVCIDNPANEYLIQIGAQFSSS
ncbi:hypothetical protein F5884DRAFT_827058 [Xylogone sp. PMI_703]|nr:hypothetical protein F5884DRAFT_827058 [Xylogone sp. PMI_703]